MFGSRTGGNANNGLIYWSIHSQGARRVPQVQRESQRLPIQTLGQDHAVGLFPGKVTLDKRSRTGTLSRRAWRLAGYGDDSRAI